MLAHFPATESEQPVTRDYLDLRLAELRVELRTEMHQTTTRLLIWIPTAMAAISGAMVALVQALGD